MRLIISISYLTLINIISVALACQTDSDCASSEVYTTCFSNKCIKKPCSSDKDCITNQIATKCVQNTCSIVQCDKNIDCISDLFFYGCNEAKYCHPISGINEEYPISSDGFYSKKPCTLDDDCSSNRRYLACTNGFCSKKDCSSDSECSNINPISLCGTFEDFYSRKISGCTNIECLYDLQCAKHPNFGCNMHINQCELMSCESNEDCKSNYLEYPVCEDGFCKGDTCENDEYCFQNYEARPLCKNGRCESVTCKTNADCNGHEWLTVCWDGFCIPQTCYTSDDCQVDISQLYYQKCQLRFCRPVIEENGECNDPGYSQKDGKYCKRATCKSNADCNGEMLENCYKGFCSANLFLCDQEADCVSPTTDWNCDYFGNLCWYRSCSSDEDCKTMKFFRKCTYLPESFGYYCNKWHCDTSADCFEDAPLCRNSTCLPIPCSQASDCLDSPLTPFCRSGICQRKFCKTHLECNELPQTRMCQNGKCVKQICFSDNDCISIIGLPYCGPNGQCIEASCQSSEDCKTYPKYRKCGKNSTCIEDSCSTNEECKIYGDNMLCGLGGYCVKMI